MVNLGLHIVAKEGLVELKRRIKGLERAAVNSEDMTPGFKAVGRKLDAQIRTAFRAGWPNKPLSATTLDQRARNSGWYSQSGGGKTGRWTSTMYQGLLGLPPRGRIEMTPTSYSRIYKLSGESFRGRDVARRVVWFHEGNPRAEKPQPARPIWKPGQRSRIAAGVMEAFFEDRIRRPAAGLTRRTK